MRAGGPDIANPPANADGDDEIGNQHNLRGSANSAGPSPVIVEPTVATKNNSAPAPGTENSDKAVIKGDGSVTYKGQTYSENQVEVSGDSDKTYRITVDKDGESNKKTFNKDGDEASPGLGSEAIVISVVLLIVVILALVLCLTTQEEEDDSDSSESETESSNSSSDDE